jgi:hypothetical protein
MFGALADAWAGQPPEEKLRTLEELERQMAAALLPLLHECSVDGGDDHRSQQTGRDTAAALAGNSWESFLNLFGPATSEALEKYHRLRDLAPDRDRTELKQLVAHEEALRTFARAEVNGDDQHSLTPIREVLAWLSQD